MSGERRHRLAFTLDAATFLGTGIVGTVRVIQVKDAGERSLVFQLETRIATQAVADAIVASTEAYYVAVENDLFLTTLTSLGAPTGGLLWAVTSDSLFAEISVPSGKVTEFRTALNGGVAP